MIKAIMSVTIYMCVWCVCVYDCEREKEKDIETETDEEAV